MIVFDWCQCKCVIVELTNQKYTRWVNVYSLTLIVFKLFIVWYKFETILLISHLIPLDCNPDNNDLVSSIGNELDDCADFYRECRKIIKRSIRGKRR